MASEKRVDELVAGDWIWRGPAGHQQPVKVENVFPILDGVTVKFTGFEFTASDYVFVIADVAPGGER